MDDLPRFGRGLGFVWLICPPETSDINFQFAIVAGALRQKVMVGHGLARSGPWSLEIRKNAVGNSVPFKSLLREPTDCSQDHMKKPSGVGGRKFSAYSLSMPTPDTKGQI
jgi:hypothetical protein